MNDKNTEADKPEPARRKTFKPHDDPKAQPDGDPGVNKPAREDDVADTAEEAAERAKVSD